MTPSLISLLLQRDFPPPKPRAYESSMLKNDGVIGWVLLETRPTVSSLGLPRFYRTGPISTYDVEWKGEGKSERLHIRTHRFFSEQTSVLALCLCTTRLCYLWCRQRAG